ncbi:MAG TPA: DNA polymerase III subunit beta [Nitrospirae bacterium]|nr:DNA polymerase III subunit beta [bacterium BMS3Abin06]HDH12127.1 DNA polymerase III subunit beta [Nitrospirota bacterium]HDZ02367.1 DNA polymerase III subunit beta [Nitrospirota bacterium]
MKLKIQKEAIQNALQGIQGIVDKKTTMPILSHFLLKAGKTASLMATDLDIALKGPLDAEILEEGGLCIPAKKLFEIAREVEGEILLEAQENNWIKVTSGKSTFKLMGLPEEDFPALPEVTKSEELTIKAGTLKDMIEKTIYATGESDTRYTLNGLLMHFIPKKKEIEFKVIGTDGHRLSAITVNIEGTVTEEKKLILPKKAAMELKKLIEGSSDNITIYIDKNHIFFSTDDVVLTSRLIEGTYPNYEQVIPKNNEKKVVVEKIAFLKALRRTSIMSREKTNAVRLDLEAGKITLISMNPDIGEAREEIAAEYKDEPMTVGYNARYLMDILQAMEGETVTMELQEPLSPTLLLSPDSKGYICVAMPMRT